MFVSPMMFGDCCDFCDICLYQRNMALHGTPLLLTEENQVLIFGTLKFDHLPRSAVVTSTFFKNCKKVHEWYLAVKCEKVIKWIRFLCVKRRKFLRKTPKNQYFCR